MKKFTRAARQFHIRKFFPARYLFEALLSTVVWFQAVSAAGEGNLKFHRLSLEQGLSQSTVNAIVQDSQGFMWFGTQDGLNRYDGYAFKIYRHNPADSTSLSDNFIWRLFVDSRGALWIGTQDGGLNRYHPETDRFSAFRHDPENPSGPLSNNISVIYEDRSGALWIGAWGGGLSRMDSSAKEFIHYRHDPADSSSLIFPNLGAVLEDSFGDLWVGTWNGLARMKKEDRAGKIFTRYYSNSKDPHALPYEKIWSLLEDPTRPGDILIGTYGGGVCKFERETGYFTRPQFEQKNPDIAGGSLITGMLEDNAGLLWIGAYDGGIKIFDPAKNSILQYRNHPHNPVSLSSDEVLCLYRDRAGAIWVGTGSGIAFHDQRGEKFFHYRYIPNNPQSISHNKVRAIYEDSEGGLWVGTKGGGLNYRKPGSTRFIHYLHNPADPYSISEDRVTCILERKNGEIWAGTEDGGLNRLDRAAGKFFRYRRQENRPASLSNNSIMSLLEDRAGNFWIGTSGGGLNRYNPSGNSFIQYPSDPENPNSLSGSHVWSLFEDRRGYLWIGTWGRGLNRLDPRNNRIVHYLYSLADSTSLNNNTVWSLAEDSRGNLWVGTWGGGLNLYDREKDKFYHITEQDGLPNNAVYGILADSSGCLWISTNKGIARLCWASDSGEGGFSGNPAELKRGLVIKNFDISDGLQSNEFNQGAYCKGKSGMMYFGGINGLNAFYPGSIRENSFLPPLVITAFKVFEKPVSPYQAIVTGEPLTFPYNENYFSFEYAALDFTAPGKNRYAYMLEGLDENWVFTGTRRFVSYTHLEPGEYVFRVKGTNSDGLWNEEGLSLRLIITPPYWATWWFRLLALAMVSLLVYSLYRYRLNRLLEMERLRTRLAADLHDEIAGNLSSIAMFGKIIHSEVTSGEPKTLAIMQLLERVIHLSQVSVGSIRDIIWAIDPRPENIHALLLRVHDLAANLCRAQNISLKFPEPSPGQFPPDNLSPEKRKNLWLLMKEAIQNSLKHAGASELSIQAKYKKGILRISISDNGSGFDCTQSSPGKGMSTMKSRAEQLGGKLEIASAPGRGTDIVFRGKI